MPFGGVTVPLTDEEMHEGHAGVTIIDPRSPRANPIVHASLDVEEGLDYLRFLRSR